MNKELLETINSMIERIALIELHTGETKTVSIDKHTLLDIQKELELQSIDNSNPSEALEKLERLYERGAKSIEDEQAFELYTQYRDTIKQVLIKSQEQEKALEIVFEKNVNIEYLKVSDNVKEYNSKITIVIDGIKYAKSMARKLAQKEFELLKRYFK